MAPMSERQHQRPHVAAAPRTDGGGATSAIGVHTTDRRLLRGARTRREITRHAVDIASLEGLGGLSIGRLAGDLGLSKSGIQTLFGSKEKLQLATAETAREWFTDVVIRPAESRPPGAARLRALTENWIAYARTPLFAGGCFWAANLPDFDSRPGPVRDTLAGHRRSWLALIAHELRLVADAGPGTGTAPQVAAFQIDAVFNAANTAFRLGEDDPTDTVRGVVESFLAPSP
jgi:AcrR family transcriptional regulator